MVNDIWTGRNDGRFHQLVSCQSVGDLVEDGFSGKIFGLIGFACDEGVRRNHGRVGACEGPAALRAALAPLATRFRRSVRIYDFGDVVCEDGDMEGAQARLGTVIAQLIKKNIFPIIMGGGHEVAWGHYLGHKEASPKENFEIVNFDAHFDLRPLEEGKGSSGTPFLQVAHDLEERDLPFHYACYGIQELGNTEALFQAADNLGVRYRLSDQIDEAFEHSLPMLLTVCLDVFSAAVAPGVSAPQSLGVMPEKVVPHIKQFAGSGRVASLSIAELNPKYDQGNITAKLAASLVNHFIHGAVNA